MNVYDKMDSHFSDVSAFAVMKSGAIIGRVLFKFTRSGVCHAYVHEWGYPAIAGKAGGYGYDKQGAAIADAIKGLENESGLYSALAEVTYDGQWQQLLLDHGYKTQNII